MSVKSGFRFPYTGPAGPLAANPKLVELRMEGEDTVYSYGHSVRPGSRDYLANLGIRLEWKRGARPHGHPVCDVLRTLAETEMHRLISAADSRPHITVVEFGANILRTESILRQLGLSSRVAIRFMMPALQQGDDLRAIARVGRVTCSHTVEQCCDVGLFGAAPDCAVADFACSVHSAYYSTAEAHAVFLDRATRRKEGFHVVHRVDDAFVSVCNQELTGRVGRDGVGTYRAEENTYSYTHAPNGFMFNGPHLTSVGPLCTEVVYRLGDVYVVRMWISATPLFVSVPRPFRFQDVTQEGFDGIVTAIPSGPIPDELPAMLNGIAVVTPSMRVHSLFGVIFTDTSDHPTVVLPRGLVPALAALAVGQVRTPALLRTITAHCLKLMKTNMCPADLLPDIVTVAPIVALLATVERETALLGRAVVTHSGLLAAHTRAVGWGGVARDNMCRRGALWCRPGMCLDDFESPEAVVFRPHDDTTIFKRLVQSRTTVHLDRPYYVQDLAFPPMSERKPKPTPPQKPGSRVRLLPDPPPPRLLEQMRLVGLGMSDAVPTYVDKTQEAAYDAVTQRVNADNGLTPDPEAWELVARARANPTSWFYIPIPPEGYDCTREEFAHWAELNYHANRVTQLLRAWDSLTERPLCQEDMAMDGLLKLEKGAMQSTARGIYANRDRAIAASALQFKALGRLLRATFDPRLNGPLCWVSGVTGLEFGAWWDHQRRGHPDWLALVYDQMRFEAARKAESRDAWNKTARKLDPDPDFQFYVEHSGVTKVTFERERVSAKVVHSLTSGKGETSVWSEVDNQASSLTALGEPVADLRSVWGPPDPDLVRYAAATNGDDGVILHPPGFLTLEGWDAGNARLGFLAESYICHPWNAEFCRTRPYPSSLGTYWSVMIGRILARLGWYIDAGNPVSPLAIAIGLRDSTHHVPFVRLLIARMIELGGPVLPEAARTNEWNLRGDEPADPTDETYAMVQHVYGLTRDDEDDFGRLLKTLREFPVVVTWGHLQACLDVDDSNVH